MTFKKTLVLGAAAAALALIGCEDRGQQELDDTEWGDEQPGMGTGDTGGLDVDGTGGAGTDPENVTIPGGATTIGGTEQTERPGTELGGTGRTTQEGDSGTETR